MSSVKVNIAGKDYNLNSDEAPSYVLAIAKKLDKKINEIMEGNESLSYANTCMLAALSYVDSETKLSDDIDNLRFQLKEYIDEATKANAKVEELTKRLEVLETENKQMANDLQIYTLKEKIDNE